MSGSFENLLEVNPQKRITIDQILNHRWIENNEINNGKNKIVSNSKFNKIIFLQMQKKFYFQTQILNIRIVGKMLS